MSSRLTNAQSGGLASSGGRVTLNCNQHCRPLASVQDFCQWLAEDEDRLEAFKVHRQRSIEKAVAGKLVIPLEPEADTQNA